MTMDSRAEPRRFRLADILALIGAAALMFSARRGIAGLKSWGDPYGLYRDQDITAALWTLTLLGFDLALFLYVVGRRDGRARLCLGAPGLLVHVAVVLAALLMLSGWATSWGMTTWKGTARHPWNRLVLTRLVIAALIGDFRLVAVIAIAGCWIALALVGRWAPRKDWDDRLGRLVGAAWLALFVVMA